MNERPGLSPEKERELRERYQSERDALRAEVARLNGEAGQCGLCGGPMSRNPHPDAGKPASLLTVGAMAECVPCNRKALHGWSQRALKAEAEVEVLRRALFEVCNLWACEANCPVGHDCIPSCPDCLSEWAISEARKGEG